MKCMNHFHEPLTDQMALLYTEHFFVKSSSFISTGISGCGSVLNVKGEVEMDAIVMDGKTLGSGAVSAVRNIANPVQLARLVMDKVCMWTGLMKCA